MKFLVRVPLVVTMDVYAPDAEVRDQMDQAEVEQIAAAAYRACGFAGKGSKYQVGRRLISMSGPPLFERLADDQTMMGRLQVRVEGAGA